MSLHQEIILGVTGQGLVHYCTDSRPQSVVSVTAHAYDADDSTIEFTADTPGVDTVSTTSTAVAGTSTDNPHQITLTSVTGIVIGRTYRFQSVVGYSEWVVPAAISGLVVTLRHPLHNSFPIGAAFQSTLIYGFIPDAWAADTSNLTSPAKRVGYRIRWVYADDGGNRRVAQSTASLVRYETRNHVLPTHVDARFPGWMERLPTDYQGDQGKALIDIAFDAVRLDLLQEGQADHAVRDPAAFSDLVIHKTIEIATEVNARHGAVSQESLLVAQRGYTERLTRLIRQPSVDIQHSDGGASGEGRRKNIFSR